VVMADEQETEQLPVGFELRKLRIVEHLAVPREDLRVKSEWHDLEFRRRSSKAPPDVLAKGSCRYHVYLRRPHRSPGKPAFQTVGDKLAVEMSLLEVVFEGFRVVEIVPIEENLRHR